MTSPIIAITWGRQYDAVLGTTPTAQGWTKSGTPGTSDTPSGGLLRMDGAGYWSRTDLANAPTNGHVLVHARLRLETAHVYGWDIYSSTPNISTYNSPRVSVFGSYSGFGQHRYTFYDPYNGSVQGWLNMLSTTGVLFDLMMATPIVGGVAAPRRTALWYRAAGANSRDDALGYTKLGHSTLIGIGPSNVLQFGDLFIGAGHDVSVECVRYGTVSTSQILSTDGQALFDETIASMPSIALAINDTTLDAGQSATITPTITGTLTATLAGNALSNGVPATVATANTPTPPSIDIVTSDTTPDPGQQVYQTPTITGAVTARIDGVTLADGVPLPLLVPTVPPTPIVNVLHSRATVQPGQDSDVSAATSSGTVILQREGSAWDGTAQTAVTGIAGPYSPPGTPPAPSPYRSPGVPAGPTWRTDVTNLSIPAGVAGTLPITHLVLGYQTTPTGTSKTALTEVAGFTSGEVSAGTVAYPGSFPAVITAWSALIAKILTLFPQAIVGVGYDDGQVITWSAFIVPTAQAEFECTISGTIDPDHLPADGRPAYVEVSLEEVFDVGDRQYLIKGYRGLINSTTGNWEVGELPRGRIANFSFPYLKSVRRVLPSTSTARYGTLQAPPAGS